MLSSCCASVVNLDKRLHEASKPVSSHSLSLDRTQKVPNRQHRFTTLQHLHRCRCAVQHQRSQSAWPDLCLPILHYRSRGTLGVMAFGSIMARALQLVCLLAASMCLLPFLASGTNGPSVWSRVAPRAMSGLSISYESSSPEGSRRCMLPLFRLRL